MSIITIIGIDPGLVHTGVVMIKIDTIKNVHRVEHHTVDGDDPRATAAWVHHRDPSQFAHIFIEQYIDRGTVFSTHSKMREFETELKRAIPGAKLVKNTGVKKVVTDTMLKLLDAWKFPTTNHRDLQAAARIGVYGALKEPELNRAFYNVVTKILDERTNHV